MGIFDSVRRQFDDTPGGGIIESGPLEGSSNVLETQYRGFTGTLDYLGAVRNDPRYFDDGSQEEMRESFQLTGISRDAWDFFNDYQSSWGGEEDSTDVAGPPVFGSEGSVLDVLVTTEGEDHGPREWSTKLLLAGLVGLVVLYLLAPLLELGASVAGDDG